FLHEVATGWQRQLTHADAVHPQPAFSPDGREIAFLSTRAGAQQIFVSARDGGEPRQITEMPRGVGGGPVWSPDGSALAFTAGPQ
ncbi:S9 family peptidase, partial [Listeria monocytogenes]|nr:S9 family peptidase [Listeria monocytogenes]